MADTAVRPRAAQPARRRPSPPGHPPLRVVDDRRLSRGSRRRRTRLVAVVAAVLATACLFGMAAFHAMLISGQVELDRLEQRVADQQARYERHRLEVASLEAPDRIVAVAQERLGMVPPEGVTYLSPSGVVAGGTGDEPDDPDDGGRPGVQPWATVKPYLGPRP